MRRKSPDSPDRDLAQQNGEETPLRRARTFRELSQLILLRASRPVGLRSFLTDICQLLTTFTASDAVEIWVLMGQRRLVGWSYDRKNRNITPIGTEELTPEGLIPSRNDTHPPLPFRSAAPLILRFGADVCGWIELRSVQPAFYTPAKLDLYEDIALNLGAAIAFQRAQHAQRERVKELSCLYQIARVSSSSPARSVADYACKASTKHW